MDSNEGHNLNLYEGTAYTLTRNIMVTAIIVLCFILFLIISLHLYARWYLRRVRRRRRRRHFVFYVDSVSAGIPPQGLDPSLLHSLPVFLYSSDTHPPSECAVCLSEFEDNESGRVLPQCNHAFHVDCIDMWFHSHSTCPLCRSLVETPLPGSEVVVIDVCEPGSSSDRIDEQEPNKRTGPKLYSSKSWVGLRRKSSSTSVGATIEVPNTRSFGREIKASYNSLDTLDL